jgi:hypothetical protein
VSKSRWSEEPRDDAADDRQRQGGAGDDPRRSPHRERLAEQHVLQPGLQP